MRPFRRIRTTGMEQSQDLVKILSSNHPAKPYLIVGGLIAGYGLLRSGANSLAYLLAGGVILAKGFEEIKRINDLHGGSYHGVNGPPMNGQD